MRNAPFGQMTKYTALNVKFNYAELLAKLQANEPQNIEEDTWYSLINHEKIVYGEDVTLDEMSPDVMHLHVIRRVLGTAWKYNQTDMIILNLRDMTVTISYYGTTLAKLYPDGRVIFAKLWDFRDEKETKKRLDFIAMSNGGSVYQKNGEWRLTWSANENGNYVDSGMVKFGVCSYNQHSYDSLLNGTYEEIKNGDSRYPQPPEYWY